MTSLHGYHSFDFRDALRAGGDRLAVHPLRAHHILSLPAYPRPYGEGRQRSGAIQLRQRAEQAKDQQTATRHDLVASGFGDNRYVCTIIVGTECG